eukprot:gene4143-7453_t
MKGVKIDSSLNNLQCQVDEIKLLKSKKEICFKFRNFENPIKFSSEFLRVYSPSIESMSGNDIDTRLLVYKKKNVKIVSIETVGNYAIRISFDDKHDSGIYSYSYIFQLGVQKYTLSKQYLKICAQVQLRYN